MSGLGFIGDGGSELKSYVRREFLSEISPSGGELGALLDQSVWSPRALIGPIPGDGENVSIFALKRSGT